MNGRVGLRSGVIPRQKRWTLSCVPYLQPVCPHQLLCGGMRDRDAGVAGDQYRGTGQDVRRHQTRRHGAKVGVKCSRGCRGSVDVSGEAGRDREHGLWATRKTTKYYYTKLTFVTIMMKTGDSDRGGKNKQLLVLDQDQTKKKPKNWLLVFHFTSFIFGNTVETTFMRQRSRTARFSKNEEH